MLVVELGGVDAERRRLRVPQRPVEEGAGEAAASSVDVAVAVAEAASVVDPATLLLEVEVGFEEPVLLDDVDDSDDEPESEPEPPLTNLAIGPPGKT